MRRITVYTRPACGPCMATKRMLTNRGLEFTEVDVASAEPEQLRQLNELGHQQAPVVVVNEPTTQPPTQARSWSGFRPDLIDAITTDSTGRTP